MYARESTLRFSIILAVVTFFLWTLGGRLWVPAATFILGPMFGYWVGAAVVISTLTKDLDKETTNV